MTQQKIRKLLVGYRFITRFYFDSGDGGLSDGLEVGATAIRISSQGFEVWRGLVPGRNLMEDIGGACEAEVLVSESRGTRKVELGLSQPRYFPFGGLGTIAAEGVLFQGAEVLGVRDVPQEAADRGIEEGLTVLCHAQWSEWMRHVFSLCTTNEDGSIVIPCGNVVGLNNRMKADYGDLSEEEKGQVLVMAKQILDLIHGMPELFGGNP